VKAQLRIAAVAVIAALSACTPNGLGVSGGTGTGTTTATSHIVDVNLTLNLPVSTPYGQSGGMKPAITMASVGDTIRFVNSDGFAHTSTSIGGATSFPAASPFTVAALTQRGATLSGGWTSGAMQAGSGSQTILVDKAGTYLFGCFFHYGAPMRGAIVAQ
jgi:plastocyanin